MTNNDVEVKVKEKEPFRKKLKDDWNTMVDSWKDPTKKKIRGKNTLMFFGKLIRGLILIGLCFVILLPIFEKISAALRHPMTISDPQVVFIPSQFSIVNFQIAWELLGVWDTSATSFALTSTLLNTVIVSTVTMLIQIIATAVAGYSFARLKFKGNGILFYAVVFTLVVPNETLHIARYLLLPNTPFFGINLVGNIFSLYILAAFGQGIRSAIFIYLFRQFFKNLPKELEESAQVDGAGVIRTFWSVMLPNARGAIVTVGLFAFVWQWNDYYFANLLSYSTSFPLLSTKLGATERLDTIINTWRAAGKEVLQGVEDVAQDPKFRGLIANTAALLMMLPLLIGYFFVQKQFVESIERTGIVG